MDPTAARALWRVAEPVHAVTYFAPEVRASLAAAGMKGFWMGYFAARAAPLGPVGPGVVEATFYNFHPDRVRRAIPEAWTFAAPAAVLHARDSGVETALGRLVGDVSPDLAAAARRVADALPPQGRPLFAAHADLPWPADDRLRLWQAATRIREHRGDGHVAVLVSEGIEPCAAHVLAVARGVADAELQRVSRGWDEADWTGAADRLAGRGLVTGEGELTTAGRDLVDHVEGRTDALAAAGLAAAGSVDVAALFEGLGPIAAAVSGAIPFPNPMGLPHPDAD